MFKKQDFKKIDLLGSGKKNTKIYKVEHIPTGKIYALKEVEAQSLEKLNEYKEEAVQLTRTMNHPNVMNFYGYYFYETMYNTYKLALVCEFLPQKYNLEGIFRRRKKQGIFWKVREYHTMVASLLKLLSYLQTIGMCHRDIKPSNMFLMVNHEVKLIDFGESTVRVKKKGEEPTMATIRGTPQYLSPILWRAHVVEGNTRHAKHNIYKSDVFSTGLVLIQMGIMDDVTGFNQKSYKNDGEKLIEKSVIQISKQYGSTVAEIINKMLRFDERERFDFVQLANCYLENPLNEDQSVIARLKRLPGDLIEEEPFKELLLETVDEEQKLHPRPPKSLTSKKPVDIESIPKHKDEEQKIITGERSSDQLLTQAELFKAYVKTNELYVNQCENTYWFEFGGNLIGEYDVLQQEGNWKMIARYQHDFATHFVLIIVPEHGTFLMGPNSAGSCLLFKERRLRARQNMLQEKTFFSAVHINFRIYTFGGYDSAEKIQLSSCEVYDVNKDHWTALRSSLHQARSQSAACALDADSIYIFGGYQKNIGTLSSIEHLTIHDESISLIELVMPTPLRRFSALKIAPNKLLLLGGVQKLSKESDAVYCVDLEEHQTIERLDKLSKGGVLEHPLITDAVGCLHLFVENCSGTAPPYHIAYSFLEYS